MVPPTFNSSERTLMLATLIHRYYTIRKSHHDKVLRLNQVLLTPTAAPSYV
jgi:hypothetical protein